GSVACTVPPESFHTNQESIVPKQSSPSAARSAARATLSSSQRSLVPEKYGSRTRPVFWRTRGSRPRVRSSSQKDAVRRSCQTIDDEHGRARRALIDRDDVGHG